MLNKPNNAISSSSKELYESEAINSNLIISNKDEIYFRNNLYSKRGSVLFHLWLGSLFALLSAIPILSSPLFFFFSLSFFNLSELKSPILLSQIGLLVLFNSKYL